MTNPNEDIEKIVAEGVRLSHIATSFTGTRDGETWLTERLTTFAAAQRKEGLDEGLGTANKGKLYELVIEKGKKEGMREAFAVARGIVDGEIWFVANGMPTAEAIKIFNAHNKSIDTIKDFLQAKETELLGSDSEV